MVKWISVAAADYFCDFYLYLTSLLSNYFYLFISIYKALWPNRQGKWLLTYECENEKITADEVSFFFASKFTKKIEPIDSAFKKQFEKEKMTGDEVIFLLLNLQKN